MSFNQLVLLAAAAAAAAYRNRSLTHVMIVDDACVRSYRRNEWLDLKSLTFAEYTDVVWVKIKGWPWWPAQLGREFVNGDLVTKPNRSFVEFCGTYETAEVSTGNIKPWLENYDEYRKGKRAKFVDVVREAQELYDGLQSRTVLLEEDLKHQAVIERQKRTPPEEWVGKSVGVWWEMDEAWYPAVVKRYSAKTGKHFLLYTDLGVEWVNFSSFDVVVRLEPEPNGSTDPSAAAAGVATSATSSSSSSSSSGGVNVVSAVPDQLCTCWGCRDFIDSIDQTANSMLEKTVQCTRCARLCHARCFIPLKPDASGTEREIRCPDCLKCNNCGYAHPPTVVSADDAAPHVSRHLNPHKPKPSFMELRCVYLSFPCIDLYAVFLLGRSFGASLV